MSPYGTIITIHRAEVIVPENVFLQYGHTAMYAQFSLSASHPLAASGQDSYCQVIEWAEDVSRDKCETFINRWHNQILDWKRELA